MDKPEEPLTFSDYHPKQKAIWRKIKEEKTETLEEAIEGIKTRLGWTVFLLFLILMALGDISGKLGD